VRGPGTLVNLAGFNAASGVAGTYHLILDGIVAGPSGEWIVCGTVAGSGTIKASRLIHTGGTEAYLRSSSSGNFRPVISASDCVNFVKPKAALNNETPTGAIQRVSILASADNEPATGGVLRFVGSFTLADGASKQLPYSGVNVSAGILIVSVGSGRNDQGMFAVDGSGVNTLAAGSGFVATGTTEPATGNFRVWSGGAAGPWISNRSGTSRTISCWMLG